MAKYFFPSSFLLFLGNWIGQITLNWYVFTLYHNAVHLALINFFRLIPILFISVWAGKITDKYNRGTLLRTTITSSFSLTAILTVLIFSFGKLPIAVFVVYSLGRGILSAVETPVRQAVLPDISDKLSIAQAVSYHSFIINICRSIGPAVAGFVIASFSSKYGFLLQSICYGISILFCLKLVFEHQTPDNEDDDDNSKFTLKVVLDYLRSNTNSRRIVITSFVIMATGFCYTTLLPVLTDYNFPDQAQIFGIAMTFSAVGGILATLIIPHVLKHFSVTATYYLSSLLFGVALIGTIIANSIMLFIVLFFIGLFSQWSRTTNRIYFQYDVDPKNRGKILSVIMMDRGMILLGAMVLSVLSETVGIVYTFVTMGLITLIVSIVFGLLSRKTNDGGRSYES